MYIMFIVCLLICILCMYAYLKSEVYSKSVFYVMPIKFK